MSERAEDTGRDASDRVLAPRFAERLKHRFIRTPIQPLMERAERWLRLPMRLRYPELHEVHEEDWYVDRLVARVVGPETNCLDVGVHLGRMLNAIVRHAPRGQHVGIEAVPYKVEWARRKFPEVVVHQCAVSSTTGSASFNVSPSASATGSLAHLRAADARTIMVELRTLDALIPPDLTFGFVKIDVEGAEPDVIMGGRATLLRGDPVVLLESTEEGHRNFHRTSGALFDLLVDLGMAVWSVKGFMLGDVMLDRATFKELHRWPFRAQNFVALREPARRRVQQGPK